MRRKAKQAATQARPYGGTEGIRLPSPRGRPKIFLLTEEVYSDKLQDLQGKTNPGVDQAKVEEALNKIDTSLEQLKGEIGGGSSSDDMDIASPEQIAATGEDQEEGSSEDSGEEPSTTEGEGTEEESSTEETPDEGGESAEGEEDDTNFDELFA